MDRRFVGGCIVVWAHACSPPAPIVQIPAARVDAAPAPSAGGVPNAPPTELRLPREPGAYILDLSARGSGSAPDECHDLISFGYTRNDNGHLNFAEASLGEPRHQVLSGGRTWFVAPWNGREGSCPEDAAFVSDTVGNAGLLLRVRSRSPGRARVLESMLPTVGAGEAYARPRAGMVLYKVGPYLFQAPLRYPFAGFLAYFDEGRFGAGVLDSADRKCSNRDSAEYWHGTWKNGNLNGRVTEEADIDGSLDVFVLLRDACVRVTFQPEHPHSADPRERLGMFADGAVWRGALERIAALAERGISPAARPEPNP